MIAAGVNEKHSIVDDDHIKWCGAVVDNIAIVWWNLGSDSVIHYMTAPADLNRIAKPSLNTATSDQQVLQCTTTAQTDRVCRAGTQQHEFIMNHYWLDMFTTCNFLFCHRKEFIWINVQPFIRVLMNVISHITPACCYCQDGSFSQLISSCLSGAELVDSVLDVVRKESESCDCLQVRTRVSGENCFRSQISANYDITIITLIWCRNLMQAHVL